MDGTSVFDQTHNPGETNWSIGSSRRCVTPTCSNDLRFREIRRVSKWGEILCAQTNAHGYSVPYPGPHAHEIERGSHTLHSLALERVSVSVARETTDNGQRYDTAYGTWLGQRGGGGWKPKEDDVETSRDPQHGQLPNSLSDVPAQRPALSSLCARPGRHHRASINILAGHASGHIILESRCAPRPSSSHHW